MKSENAEGLYSLSQKIAKNTRSKAYSLYIHFPRRFIISRPFLRFAPPTLTITLDFWLHK